MQKIQTIQHCIKLMQWPSFLAGEPSIPISGLSNPATVIYGQDGVSAYNDLAGSIFKRKDIASNYTLDHVKNVLNDVIYNNLNSPSLSDGKITSLCSSQLPTTPLQTFKLYRPIFGIKFTRYRQFAHFSFHLKQSVYRHFKNRLLRKSMKDLSADYFIRMVVSSATHDRARELADEKFDMIEHLFAFLIGRKRSGYEIRILRPSQAYGHSYFCLSSTTNESWGRGIANPVHQILDLSDAFFKDRIIKSCFHIIGQLTPSPIEGRIVHAIIWIGRGLSSLNPSQSIICYATAMESLLIRQKGTIIAPSIIADLSDQCAFLLGKKFQDRIAIAKYVKDIYAERSAATHGGKVFGSEREENLALQVARHLTFKFIELYNKGMTDESKIAALIAKQKYGF